jgi:hypothetical protein
LHRASRPGRGTVSAPRLVTLTYHIK